MNNEYIGLIEVTDIGGVFSTNPTAQSTATELPIYWLGGFSSTNDNFSQNVTSSAVKYLYNPNDFSVNVNYKLTGTPLTDSTFLSGSLISNSAGSIGPNRYTPITASYNGAAGLGFQTLSISSSVSLVTYTQNVIVGAPPTPTPTPTPTATPTPTPTPTGIAPTPAPSVYHLSVNGGQAGIIASPTQPDGGAGYYSPGTIVNVSAGIASGYVFNAWSDDIGYLLDGQFANPNRILMPSTNIGITPTAVLIPVDFQFTYISATGNTYLGGNNNLSITVQPNASADVGLLIDLTADSVISPSHSVTIILKDVVSNSTIWSTTITTAILVTNSINLPTANNKYSLTISAAHSLPNTVFASVSRTGGGNFVYGSAQCVIDLTNAASCNVSGIPTNSTYHYNIRNATYTSHNFDSYTIVDSTGTKSMTSVGDGVGAAPAYSIGYIEIVPLSVGFSHPTLSPS